MLPLVEERVVLFQLIYYSKHAVVKDDVYILWGACLESKSTMDYNSSGLIYAVDLKSTHPFFFFKCLIFFFFLTQK